MKSWSSMKMSLGLPTQFHEFRYTPSALKICTREFSRSAM
jgi:hypothetical protein